MPDTPPLSLENVAPDTIDCALLSCPTGKGNELFDAIQDPVLVVTPEGIIIDANLAAINAAHKTKSQIKKTTLEIPMKNNPGMDKSRAQSSTATNASTEISKIGITAVGITAGIIGCWPIASMIAGTVNSGGPIDLMVSLFTAITG